MLGKETDLPQITTLNESPSSKVCPSYYLAYLLIAISSGLIGFWVGRISVSNSKQTVLGVQTNQTGILALLRFNLERPMQDSLNLRINETLQTTDEGEKQIDGTENAEEINDAPDSEDEDTPDMMWSGLNRNPTPTPTPKIIIAIPTAEPIETPIDKMYDGQNRKSTPKPSAEATPDYYRKPGRDRTLPTPGNLNPIEEKNLLDSFPMDNKATLSGTPTARTITPVIIDSMLNQAGFQFEAREFTQNKDQNITSVTGLVKDKLFGFLPISYPIVISVGNENGEVTTVSMPWWRSLFGKKNWDNLSKVRCGDQICSTSESYLTCPTDCTPVCGNGTCEYGEGSDTCDLDCTVSE